MKHWKIWYSIKYKEGEVEIHYATVEGTNIAAAVAWALVNIREPLHKDPEIEDVVIWEAGMIEDDVF